MCVRKKPNEVYGQLRFTDGEYRACGRRDRFDGIVVRGTEVVRGRTDRRRRARGAARFGQTKKWLDIYFGGGEPAFTPAVALRGSEFQIAVWNVLSAIPYGKTVTYGEIAKNLTAVTGRKTSARAVGSAVGRNPVSIIVPCHRVLGADGSLTGYAGGVERKRELLRLEGVLL